MRRPPPSPTAAPARRRGVCLVVASLSLGFLFEDVAGHFFALRAHLSPSVPTVIPFQGSPRCLDHSGYSITLYYLSEAILESWAAVLWFSLDTRHHPTQA